MGVLTGGEADSRITRLFMSDFSLLNVYLTTSRFLPQPGDIRAYYVMDLFIYYFSRADLSSFFVFFENFASGRYI